MDHGNPGDRVRDLHVVIAGDTGQGDVADVAGELSVDERVSALELQVERQTSEIGYLRRRVAMLERALSGIQGAVAVLDAEEAALAEETGPS